LFELPLRTILTIVVAAGAYIYFKTFDTFLEIFPLKFLFQVPREDLKTAFGCV